MNLRIYRTVELIHEGKVVCTLHDLIHPEEATRDLGEGRREWKERETRRRNLGFNLDVRTTWKPVQVDEELERKSRELSERVTHV